MLHGLFSFISFTLLCRFCQYQAFLQVVKELNDFAGQREVVAENLLTRICVELAKYSQELKQERKSVNYLCQRTVCESHPLK